MNDSNHKSTAGHDWPASLDAVRAAPDHHEILLENEYVRVLDTRIEPGEKVPVHTHRWPGVVYVMATNDFVRYDSEGNVVLDSRTTQFDLEPGQVVWLPSLSPHSIENVGNGEIRSISVEIKNTEPY